MRGRGGFTSGDFLILLGALSVAATLVVPALRGREFRATVTAAVAEVAGARAAVDAYRDGEGVWPPDRRTDPVPDVLSRIMAGRATSPEGGYRLGWTQWEVVHVPTLPEVSDPELDTLTTRPPEFRSRAALTVYSPDRGILAALLTEFGSESSFATDSTWTLVFPQH